MNGEGTFSWLAKVTKAGPPITASATYPLEVFAVTRRQLAARLSIFTTPTVRPDEQPKGK